MTTTELELQVYCAQRKLDYDEVVQEALSDYLARARWIDEQEDRFAQEQDNPKGGLFDDY
jgi:hypothetical protein